MNQRDQPLRLRFVKTRGFGAALDSKTEANTVADLT